MTTPAQLQRGPARFPRCDGPKVEVPGDADPQAKLLGGTVALADRGRLETGPVTAAGTASAFAGFRFPKEVISVAVRWYLRSGLSYRDVEELLAERGITAGHVTVYRWGRRFTAEFIEAARPGRHVPGNRWFVDEIYLRVAGKWPNVLQRFMAEHAGATIVEVPASHVSFASQPEAATQLILAAVEATAAARP
jgi:hypothetical protein